MTTNHSTPTHPETGDTILLEDGRTAFLGRINNGVVRVFPLDDDVDSFEIPLGRLTREPIPGQATLPKVGSRVFRRAHEEGTVTSVADGFVYIVPDGREDVVYRVPLERVEEPWRVMAADE